MASPEFKKWFPVVMVPSVLLASIAAAAISILNMKNGVGSPHDEVFVWPTPSASASPFPTYSASPTPTLIETPSDDATTPLPEETPTTPVATPTKSPTPMLSPNPSPNRTTASPTNKPLNVVVTDSQYHSTGVHSGLVQISAENDQHTYSAEFNTSCRTSDAVIKVVSYIDGRLITPLEEAAEHSDLTSIICDGTQLNPGLMKKPADYAGYLWPLAKIP